MWILLLMVMTSDGLIAYDQGHYETFSKCYDMKEAMLADLDKTYRATCVEW